MKTYAFCSAVLAAMLPLGACIGTGDWMDSAAYREDFHSSYALNPGARVSVESFNGSIEVVGWDQTSVEINGTKTASSREALGELKVDIHSSPDAVQIRASQPDGFFRGGVRLSIRIPHKALLDMVSSSNGRLDVEDVDGNARLRTSNGGVRVLRYRGELRAETSNGPIDLEQTDGRMDVRTSNGAVRAEVTGGSLEAVTSNGSITARLTNPAADRPVRVTSSNGHIDLSVDGGRLPEVRATTSNSSILLRLPASADAEVRAHTSHSPITSAFSSLHPSSTRRSDLEGSIGRSGPLVELRTSNGAIRIEKL